MQTETINRINELLSAEFPEFLELTFFIANMVDTLVSQGNFDVRDKELLKFNFSGVDERLCLAILTCAQPHAEKLKSWPILLERVRYRAVLRLREACDELIKHDQAARRTIFDITGQWDPGEALQRAMYQKDLRK